MAQILIFGLNEMAELAHYYFTNDSEHEVVGFTVHKKYKDKETFCDLPVIPFEETNKNLSLFAPLYSNKMNKLREKVYLESKNLGFNFVSYVSSKALTWNCEIGENCFIFEGVNLQPFTKVGNNVIIWSFSHLGHHSTIEDNVFVSGNVVISGKCRIGRNSFLGTNCTIRDGLIIGEGTLVGQDASIVKDTEPWGVYCGLPGRKVDENSLGRM